MCTLLSPIIVVMESNVRLFNMKMYAKRCNASLVFIVSMIVKQAHASNVFSASIEIEVARNDFFFWLLMFFCFFVLFFFVFSVLRYTAAFTAHSVFVSKCRQTLYDLLRMLGMLYDKLYLCRVVLR